MNEDGKYIVAVATDSGTYYINISHRPSSGYKTGLEINPSKAELMDTREACAELIVQYVREWPDGQTRHFAFVHVPFSRQLDWDKRQSTWFGTTEPCSV